MEEQLALESAYVAREPRLTTFLAAQLNVADVPITVRIRNLSVSGARIEGAPSVNEGTNAVLRRGSLKVNCTVRWIRGGNCGLQFAIPINVFEWVGRIKPHQERVDEIVAGIRAGVGSGLTDQWRNSDPIDRYAALTNLSEDLRQLGDKMVRDDHVFERYYEDLQRIDVAADEFERLALAIAGDVENGVESRCFRPLPETQSAETPSVTSHGNA